MPSVDGLDMKPTLEWYEHNLDELEEKIVECFSKHHHPLPKRIEQVAGQVKFIEGHNFDSLGLHSDDLARVLGCYNPGFWQRSVFAGLVVRPTLYFTAEMVRGLDNARPTADIALALSPTHYIPGYTEFVQTGQVDKELGYCAVVNLYQLGDDVSPDVRRIVAIEVLLHELMHTTLTPILDRVDVGRKEIKFKLGQEMVVIDEFELLERINNAYEELEDGISHYSQAYKHENSIQGLQEEICESAAALFLGFAFCEHGGLYNMSPFADRARMRELVISLVTAYRHIPQLD